MDEWTIYHNMLKKHGEYIDNLSGKFIDRIPELTDNMAAHIAALEVENAALTADRGRLVTMMREVVDDLQVYGYDENFKCLSCGQYVIHADDCTHTRAAALLAELDTEGEAK